MKTSSLIIAKILTLCGIALTCTACYGVPGTAYMTKIEGMVIDEETGDPIEGIKVSGESFIVIYDGPRYNRTRDYSDEDGKYLLHESAWPPTTITLIADDVDGAENGGEFVSKTIQIELKKSDFSKVSMEDAYDTVYETVKTVNFELEKIIPDNTEKNEE